jgi:hypothetical protein
VQQRGKQRLRLAVAAEPGERGDQGDACHRDHLVGAGAVGLGRGGAQQVNARLRAFRQRDFAGRVGREGLVSACPRGLGQEVEVLVAGSR